MVERGDTAVDWKRSVACNVDMRVRKEIMGQAKQREDHRKSGSIVCNSDIDGIFMNTHPDKRSARLLHGSSPLRKSDCARWSILRRDAACSMQPTIRSETGQFNSSHSGYTEQ